MPQGGLGKALTGSSDDSRSKLVRAEAQSGNGLAHPTGMQNWRLRTTAASTSEINLHPMLWTDLFFLRLKSCPGEQLPVLSCIITAADKVRSLGRIA